MSLKYVLKKAAGLLVEFPEDDPMPAPPDMPEIGPVPTSQPHPAPRTVEQIVKDSPGPNLDEIQVQPKDVDFVPAPGGIPQFSDIYKKAGVPDVPFSAEQALEVMASLPADLAMDVKRKTVGATLSAMGKAMGVTTDTVVADASRKLAALASYSDTLAAKTAEFNATAERKIADLQKQIEEQQRSIEDTKALLAKAVEVCHQESERLDDVLEFFSLDVPPSKYAETKPNVGDTK